MRPKQRQRGAVELSKGVHKVRSRGKEYYYFQAGRGTPFAGERVKLPSDPRTPEFWQAVRQAQGVSIATDGDTVGALIDAYKLSPKYLDLASGSKQQYDQALKTARNAWGSLPAKGLRPVHVQAVMDGLSGTPGKANTFLGGLRALNSWAIARGLIDQSITQGVQPYEKTGGHKPWTPTQIKAAKEKLTGMIRRGVMLYLYTGQRGSDVVTLGPTMVDEGGFSLVQKKTGREVWCPILPELAAEMAKWEKVPGPYLRQPSGVPYSRTRFSLHFDEAREKIPELRDVTLHGLRATAVVNLRRSGLSTAQISDCIGMSIAMIDRYCRFADKKANGKAALINLAERAKNKTVKH
jgi:integrase